MNMLGFESQTVPLTAIQLHCWYESSRRQYKWMGKAEF